MPEIHALVTTLSLELHMTFFPSRTIALTIGNFSVHWYGVMYLLGFILALILLPSLQRYRKLFLTRDEWMTILSYAVIGVIAGGRLGYVLFYEPEYFAENPVDIFAVWKGGMSFHGGLIGVALLLTFVCWQKKISVLKVMDTAIVPVAIGLALG